MKINPLGMMAALAVSLIGATALAQSPQPAPLNPEFVKFLADAKAGRLLLGAGGEHGFGLIPPPVDLSHLRAAKIQGALPADLTFDPSYDLRILGRMTPVRNQGSYGTCWAHATFGSLESCLLPSVTSDFSENNLVNLAGFDWGFNYGGNANMSMAYLARWSGPVNELDDPYPNPGGSPTGLPARRHVQQVRLISPKASPTGNDEIKQALMDCGAVDVSYYHDDTYYSSTYKSYLFTGSSSHNHAVTLAGWDDNFSKTNFTSVAAGDGAYIVKNSWGTAWGDSGYFYVSYYDTTFGHEAMFAFLNGEATDNFARIYDYDPLGWVSNVGDGTATNFWGANIFTAVAGESLGAVGFYANSVNTSYAIYIYTGVSAGAPTSGTLAATQTGTCSYPGYRTISLNTPAALTTGQRFSIVLSLTTPGSGFPQPYECVVSGYTSAATAAPGQSYYSFSGSDWTDLTTFDSTANFCIKGYTVVPTTTVTVTASDATAGEPATGQGTGTFTFSRTGSTVAALTVNYTVAGTATSGSDYTSIGTTVTFAAGSATATQTVSVIDDNLVEGDETVMLTLAAGTGYTVGSPSSATVTIKDDDSTVIVAATDATAGEPGTGQGTGTFTFTRAGYTVPALTVNYTVNGTATSGSDYTSIGTTVTFAAGSAAATQTVSVIDDNLVEGDETVVLTLAPGTGYSVGNPSAATVTIQDDDSTPNVHYVNVNNTTPAAPYLTWATAATTTQEAVNAAASGDTVLVADGAYVLSSQINLLHGITLQSVNGAGVTIIDGNHVTRCLSVAGATVTVSGFAIQNGRIDDGTGGGGILTTGQLTLNNCVVRDNDAGGGSGGGISAQAGSLVLNHVTVSGNKADGTGGIRLDGDVVASIQNTTISGNTANTATAVGGLSCLSAAAHLDLVNCTISGNQAESLSQGVGGVWNSGTLTALSCTITANQGLDGGVRNDGSFTAKNAIIAGNLSSGLGSNPDFAGTLTSQGYNLIQDTTETSIVGDTTGNLLGVDPMLGPLQDNGGPVTSGSASTFTHALLPGSPAIDKGTSGGLTTDQRGFTRPIDHAANSNADDGSDIGAFEYGMTYTWWSQGQFTGAELSDPAKEPTLWGVNADPDHDGRSNLLEYALGLQPRDAGDAGAGITTAVTDGIDGKHLTLTFNQRKTDPILQYVPEVSADKQNWFSDASNVQWAGQTDLDADFEEVTYQDLTVITTGSGRFCRLRVLNDQGGATSEAFVGTAAPVHGNGGSGSKVSLFSPQMVRSVESAGIVAALGDHTLTDGNATWVDDQFNGSNGPFYVEFDDGLLVDIIDTAGVSKTLTLSADIRGVISIGDAYRIRKHFTIATVFGASNQAGLKSGLNPTDADNVMLHIPQTQVTMTVFYYNDGHGGEGWLGADYSLAADQVICPAQGVMVRRKLASDLPICLSGPVKNRPTIIPIQPGYNLVGTLKTMIDLKLADLNLYSGNAATGLASGLNPTTSDNLLVVHSDGSTTTYFYYHDSSGQGWLDASYNLANNATISAGSAFFIQRKAPLAEFSWTIPAE